MIKQLYHNYRVLCKNGKLFNNCLIETNSHFYQKKGGI